MAHHQLPCDGDGICMICKITPPDVETLTCKTCVTPWHVKCLSSPPQTLSSTLQWDCPDCSPILTTEEDLNPPVISHINPTGNLISAIRQIQSDQSLTDQEKAKKRQDLLSGVSAQSPSHDDDDDNDDDDKSQKNKKKKKKNKEDEGSDVLAVLGSSLNCSFCMQVPERPVTTPCGHNFCLKCFEKWVGQGKRTCAKCRSTIPPKMASQPRINSALVVAIRMARASKANNGVGPLKVQHFIRNENRPDKAFTTDRAKKTGKANACSGKIFVTVPPDHFGPILAENDPDRRQGVLVGECWEDRMECRQWGAHFPHVAGIAGQSEYGAQSVALSGGYQDDEDHGEWFLYTGSGGRDLSGNKRTNKDQSFDQKFEKSNEALRVSCKKGYPVRVVRSHKEKRSAYAPESGVRYDGVYRIEKCWRKVGIQGFKVCRYLFVRCDNEPAPWTSDEHGDRPRALPVIKELKGATDITERTETPSWDYHEEEACWKWKKPPPLSRKPMDSENPEERKKARKAIKEAQYLTVREKLLKEFNCLICRKVMNLPLTTPCAHNFCKPCLEGAFTGKTFVKERTCEGRRTLRAQKVVMKCPCCPTDISDFLQNPQVNRELMDVIESLQTNLEEDTEENVELGEEDSDSEEKTEVVTEDTKKAEVVTEDTKKAKVVVDSKEVEVVITESRKDEVLMEEIKEAEVVMEETKEAEAVTVETKVVMEETKEAEVLMEETKEAEAVTETKEAKVVIEVIKEAEVVPEITEDSEIASGEDLQENPIESKSKQNKKRKKGNPSSKKPNASDKEDGMEISGSPKTETPSKRRKAHDTSHVSGSGGVRTRSMRSKELLEENHASGGVRTRRMRSG